jgi:hypothetical protein
MDKQLPPIPSRKYFINLKNEIMKKKLFKKLELLLKEKSKASTICLYR